MNNFDQHNLTLFAAPPKKSSSPVRKHTSKSITIYTDGASRGNPGKSGVGIYAVDHHDKIMLDRGYIIGHKTNNQAEYLALLIGLLVLKKKLTKKKLDTYKLNIRADSELMIKQLKGLYRVKNHALKQIKQLIDQELEDVEHTFGHIFRDKNEAADALANQGIDTRTHVPEAIVEFLGHHGVEL